MLFTTLTLSFLLAAEPPLAVFPAAADSAASASTLQSSIQNILSTNGIVVVDSLPILNYAFKQRSPSQCAQSVECLQGLARATKTSRALGCAQKDNKLSCIYVAMGAKDIVLYESANIPQQGKFNIQSTTSSVLSALKLASPSTSETTKSPNSQASTDPTTSYVQKNTGTPLPNLTPSLPPQNPDMTKEASWIPPVRLASYAAIGIGVATYVIGQFGGSPASTQAQIGIDDGNLRDTAAIKSVRSTDNYRTTQGIGLGLALVGAGGLAATHISF
jgi:hypothetical protein